jgi:hypothetical protein
MEPHIGEVVMYRERKPCGVCVGDVVPAMVVRVIPGASPPALYLVVFSGGGGYGTESMPGTEASNEGGVWWPWLDRRYAKLF